MLRVRRVIGPDRCRCGTEAVYKVVEFSETNPSAAELAEINWLIECEGREVERWLSLGDELSYTPPDALAGLSLRVMPYRTAPSPEIGVVTFIEATTAQQSSPPVAGTPARSFEIYREGSRIHASADAGPRFYVGSVVRYGRGRGIMNTGDNTGPVFDPADYRDRFGFWAEFIAPMARCESEGYFHRINTYDRARFTFGLLQHAAHTADANFILLFRRLLKLPTAVSYFPDLSLSGGRICRKTAAGLVSLERGDPPLPLMNYLNPTLDEVEDEEAINAAKFIHWCINDPTHRDVQVGFAVDDTKRKMRAYARRYGLAGMSDAVCLAVADIRHQGRAQSAEILEALDTGNSLERLLCLGEGAYPERIATLRRTLAHATRSGVFGSRRYDEDTEEFL